MIRLAFGLAGLLLLAGCDNSQHSEAGTKLPDARKGFQTRIVRREPGAPVPLPPPGLANLVYYDSPAGKMAAYLTHAPDDGQRRPAIVWISGGDCNTIDAGFFSPAPPQNDQTASAFRNAGIVTLYASLRGGNQNPGVREGFFGEVDDVLAAADFLAGQNSVDPQHIYLAGHSTGGTLALLVAASTDRFRAVFSFGPADDVGGYGEEYCPFDLANSREIELRSPVRWLHSIGCPTFIIEGVGGNHDALLTLSRRSTNPLVRAVAVKGADHFSVLQPVSTLLARKIVQDTGPPNGIELPESDLNALFGY